MWVATGKAVKQVGTVVVSIHATRVGGDQPCKRFCDACIKVSIHATRVGGDQLRIAEPYTLKQFLSTPPVWVATLPL